MAMSPCLNHAHVNDEPVAFNGAEPVLTDFLCGGPQRCGCAVSTRQPHTTRPLALMAASGAGARSTDHVERAQPLSARSCGVWPGELRLRGGTTSVAFVAGRATKPLWLAPC
jgi:hypothetical protein